MGLFGSIGGGLRKLGHGIGKIADNKYVKGATALGLQFIPGIGTAASMGIMAGMGAAGGALKPGGGLKPSLVGGATGAVSGYGAGKIGAGLRGGGMLGKAGSLMGIKRELGSFGGGTDVTDIDAVREQLEREGLPDYVNTRGGNGGGFDEDYGSGGLGALAGGLGGLAAAGGKRGLGDMAKDAISGGARRALGTAKDAVTGGGGGTNALDYALGVGALGLGTQQLLAAGKASARSGQMSDKAITQAENRWLGGAKLRQLGEAGMLAPRARPDFGAVYADPTNVFARRPLGRTLG